MSAYLPTLILSVALLSSLLFVALLAAMVVLLTRENRRQVDALEAKDLELAAAKLAAAKRTPIRYSPLDPSCRPGDVDRRTAEMVRIARLAARKPLPPAAAAVARRALAEAGRCR